MLSVRGGLVQAGPPFPVVRDLLTTKEQSSIFTFFLDIGSKRRPADGLVPGRLLSVN